MKIYKIKSPEGKVSVKMYSRALAFRQAKMLSRMTGKEYKPFVYRDNVKVYDHELTKLNGRYYEITHYSIVS